MCQKFYSTVFIGAYFLFVFPLICDSCQNSFNTFQEILQTRQQPGRFRRGRRIGAILTTLFVFTKMECLDTCLRTAECASFDVKVTQPDHNGLKEWVCVINLRPEGTLELAAKNKGWIHVNVSSQELQEILSSATDQPCERRENSGTDLPDPHPSRGDDGVIQMQETMDEYCEKNGSLQSCDDRTEGSCKRVLKARRVTPNPEDGWCCFNPRDEDMDCLLRISPSREA